MFGDCYLIVVNSVGMIHCFYCCLLLFNCVALLLVVLLVRVMVLGCFKWNCLGFGCLLPVALGWFGFVFLCGFRLWLLDLVGVCLWFVFA